MFDSSAQRVESLPAWLHGYNHHRPYTALAGKPPVSRVTNVPRFDIRAGSAWDQRFRRDTRRSTRTASANMPRSPSATHTVTAMKPNPLARTTTNSSAHYASAR